MAKRRSSNAVPEETADSFALLAGDDEVPAASAAPAKAEGPHELRTVSIDVPLRIPPTPRYAARHVEVQLDNGQAQTLRSLLDAVDERGERLQSGRRVVSAADALRWLLERVGLQSAA